MKQIEVTCPCCETLMVVDVLTQKIMRHAKPGQVDETGKAVLDEGRWDSAQDKVSKRTERGRDQFDNCLLYTSPSPRDRTRSRMPSSA